MALFLRTKKDRETTIDDLVRPKVSTAHISSLRPVHVRRVRIRKNGEELERLSQLGLWIDLALLALGLTALIGGGILFALVGWVAGVAAFILLCCVAGLVEKIDVEEWEERLERRAARPSPQREEGAT